MFLSTQFKIETEWSEQAISTTRPPNQPPRVPFLTLKTIAPTLCIVGVRQSRQSLGRYGIVVGGKVKDMVREVLAATAK